MHTVAVSVSFIYNYAKQTEFVLEEKVVLDLFKELERRILLSCFYFDNFFTTFLLNNLHIKGVYACGTARQNYKSFLDTLRIKGKVWGTICLNITEIGGICILLTVLINLHLVYINTVWDL